VTIDIEGVSALVDFEVIEIVDGNNPYRALLSIDWATYINVVINVVYLREILWGTEGGMKVNNVIMG